MSSNFNKGNFIKSDVNKKCHHCGSNDAGFTLMQKKLGEILTIPHGRKSGSYGLDVKNRIPYQMLPGLEKLYSKLRANIFIEFDTQEIDETSKMIRHWELRINRFNDEPNEALLDVLHFLGEKEKYNRLLLSLSSGWEPDIEKFFKNVYSNSRFADGSAAKRFIKNIRTQTNPVSLLHDLENNLWFTDMSKEQAVLIIIQLLDNEISGGITRNHYIREEMSKIADMIFASISELGVKKIGDWEQNHAKNSPLAILKPMPLADQFQIDGIFEGIEYCNYCGTEYSRSLMYSGKFRPLSDIKIDSPESIEYFGRIQDFESQLLPKVQELWKEQIDEFKRRDKKASKLWDSAEERLQKKKDAEEESKRQAEIAKLEKKLSALKKNDKSN